MKNKLRIGVAGALLSGVSILAIGTFDGPASAGSDCWYSGHGNIGTLESSGNNNCGHRSVWYETWREDASGHFHQYKHDVRDSPDHHPWKWISA